MEIEPDSDYMFPYEPKFKEQVMKPADMRSYVWYRIGKMHCYGLGTEQDYEKAFQWFLKSAQEGNKFAQYSLANLYYYGNGNDNKFPANAFLVGHSIGLFVGYQTAGIMQEEEYYSVENQKKPLKLANSKTDMLPGDIRYIDQNGDRVINDNDRVILGNPNPDFTFRLNTTLSYKQWTLDLAFNGVVGNEIINANLIDETLVDNANKNVRKDAFYQAWTPENKSNT